MTRSLAAQAFEWVFLGYFVMINTGYLLLDFTALAGIVPHMRERVTESFPSAGMSLEPPVSVLVPAYNEEATVEATVEALLQLNYSEYEVVVVSDGSTDGTLDALVRRFSLRPFPEAYRARLPSQPIRGIYASTIYPNLRVIDKENGGKADTLNAGINAARYPLFCSIDADSILQRDSLRRVARPFMEDARTVAAGGTVRIANGCSVRNGFLERVGVPRNLLALMQIVEYLRAFLFGRLGWSPLNALLIISGAFGLFHKETVVAAGGYRTDTVGEDMELVVRLHRHLKGRRGSYRITFVPDPICWTEVPETIRTLGRQRIRWQRGLVESLWLNRSLLFRGGAVGWLSFPFTMFFEGFGPVVEIAGYGFFVGGAIAGVLSVDAMLIFLLAAIGMGVLLSVSALLLEELSFHVYPHPGQIGLLFLAALVENFGYRQLNSVWRLVGLTRWLFGRKGEWGQMTRSAAWRRTS